jgi:electron transfer flavoprotein-quinone oxidoreductase
MNERFDAIVVGAGPAGNAAAYTMAKAGLKVLQLERGETPGSKNVQGAILYAHALEEIIPDFRDDAPLERHVVEQRMWMLDSASHLAMSYRSEDFNEAKPNRYTILRAAFDRWFSRKVREAGATVLCETTVIGLLRDAAGKVVGVSTDREEGDVFADVVVLGEGVNGLVGSRAGLRPELKSSQAALAVKEMHFLPQEVLESRFNLEGDEGVVIEAMGTVGGAQGLGFLYTNKESISIGIGCLVSQLTESGATPYGMLEAFKNHPSVKPLLQGSEMKEYSAHLIPEGGYDAVGAVHGDGWVVVGDAGQFVNSVHREGSNMAMTTGRLAAETILRLKAEGKSFTSANLSLYRKALETSYVLKDLKKYRRMPSFIHRHSGTFLGDYPRLLSQAAQSFLRVDGVDKKSKERAIFASFRQRRKVLGLLGDAFRFARATR